MTRPVSLRKEGLPGIARVRRTLNVPWNCALAGPGVSRSARAIARFGGARDPGPSGLLSSITYKRFKRSECQLVNIIIMTSNMARSLHRVTRPARETGIRLTPRSDNCSPVRRRPASVVPFLRRTNRCPVGVARIGMFCPPDLFRLKELTRPATINNLAVATTECHLGARTGNAGKRGGGRGFANLCDLVIFNEAPYLT